MSNSKSFIRWAGSKKQIVSKLKTFWDQECLRYVEPFMGSASLFFEILPAKALLSDMNTQLVEAFNAVKESPQEVYARLQLLPLGADAYYAIRALDEKEMSELDRAVRFIYLNRFCFNGLYRTNKRGKFNVPYASAKTGRLPTLDDLIAASRKLSCAQIVACDFSETLNAVKEKDFVYMDPPYAVKNHRIFRQYGPDTFGLEDLEKLAVVLPKIDLMGAFFVVSYAACPEAIELFSSWNIYTTYTRRQVAGSPSHRQKIEEIVVSNRRIETEQGNLL